MIYSGMIFSTGAYMALMGSESTARLLSPYYPVLAALPFGLIGITRTLDKKVWRVVFFLLAASAIILPITTPSRPLLPIPQLANSFNLPEKLKNRIILVYETYMKRSDALAELREVLPNHFKNIGLICSVDDTEVSLWRPFHENRRVIHIKTKDMLENVDCVIVNIDSNESKSLEQKETMMLLQSQNEWKAGDAIPITLKIQGGKQKWVIYNKTF
jgi:hypothetical protein